VVQLREELPRPVANMASIDLIADSRAAGEETVYLDDGEWLTAVFHPAERCAAYDAVLEGPGPGDRRPVPGLKRDPSGRVTLAWPPEPGPYTLRLFGCDPRRELEEHRFRVARPSPAGAGDGG
jgi:hypothetical protein